MYSKSLSAMILMTTFAVSACEDDSSNTVSSDAALQDCGILDAGIVDFENDGTFVTYKWHGAVGDGRTNDMEAIRLAHEYANEHHLPVRANPNAKYYIGQIENPAVIKTDTDWTGAEFIIDDTEISLEERNKVAFIVQSYTPVNCVISQDSWRICPNEPMTLKQGQPNIGITLDRKSVLRIEDANAPKQYVRVGGNQNDGTTQQEAILVHEDGSVDPSTPILWNYENVTMALAYAADDEELTLRGGTFTTIANNKPMEYTYYDRGIRIERSNVIVDGVTHKITGEGESGAPYSGFIVTRYAANITIKNSSFSGHKIYPTIGSGGTEVKMGSYDLSATHTINLTYQNCDQVTDILNTDLWGVMGTNFCKNITLDHVSFSRFDAHQGVANITIKDSQLGHQGLNAIGFGQMTIKNTHNYGGSFINLRSDYGSTWHGDVLIEDCTWTPRAGNPIPNMNTHIFNGINNEDHDFGYPCYLPTNVTLKNFYVNDENHTAQYDGVNLFAAFNTNHTSDDFVSPCETDQCLLRLPEHVTIEGFRTDSGKKWNLSDNPFLFKDVVIDDRDL